AVIGNEQVEPTGADKTSLMFQLNHEAGALAAAMVIFQDAGVNLTWIESFPLPQAPNEYLFFVELEGHGAESNVAAAIDQLKIKSRALDVLGSYPRAGLAS
ncbi:MAG: prephenate dehydratase, partial [Planctomycetota bacterium]